MTLDIIRPCLFCYQLQARRKRKKGMSRVISPLIHPAEIQINGQRYRVRVALDWYISKVIMCIILFEFEDE